MTEKELEKKLFGISVKKFKNKYIDCLIDQYKVYVQSAEKISDRRFEANKFFLTLNTAIIGAVGFVVVKFSDEFIFLILLATVIGGFISYYWFRIIKAYKGLNTEKFRLIHAIEKRLPLSLYYTEWEELGRGKDNKKYQPFTDIEIKIPILFISAYLVFFLVFISWKTFF